MSQMVVYRGVVVTPTQRDGQRILVECADMSAAQKAEIPFHEMRDGKAIFAVWAEESDLVAVNPAEE